MITVPRDANSSSERLRHDNVEEFDACDCESPAADPVRYEFPDGTHVDMKGCLHCGGLIEWDVTVDYSPDEVAPDELPDAGECQIHRCDDQADYVVQLRRDRRSITAYCDEHWADRKKNNELRNPDRNLEVLARVVE